MVDQDELDRAAILALYEQAMQQVHEGALDAALEAGRALVGVQFSGGFEVIALALLARGEPDEALAALREGTRVAPAVWLLWQLMGNTLSDMGRFDEAGRAYETALECPRCDAGAVHYNRALALRRGSQDEAALASCEAAIEVRPAFALPRVLRLALLNDLGRHASVRASAPELAARLGEEAADAERPADPVADPVRLRADVLAEQARAELSGGARDAARGAAEEALASGYFSARAAAVLRDLEGRASPGARRWQITVSGHWPEAFEGRPTGFLRSFEVVADEVAHALPAVLVFLPRSVRGAVTLERAVDAGPAPDSPLGVYSATSFAWYAEDEPAAP